jgi:hypothetical protein
MTKRVFQPTYLYIKTHNITGLKYFGKTIQNPIEYQGSGIRWRRHLKKHGNDVTTVIYGYYADFESLKKAALDFSIKNNIIESVEWANLIREQGEGGDTSNCFTEESRKKMRESSRGVNNRQAKLNREQVIEIYHSCKSPTDLSKEFKIGNGQISGIKRKIYYRDITEDIIEFPGISKNKKQIRVPFTSDMIIEIYYASGTPAYFKEKYHASMPVVRNIKSKKTYKAITKDLGKAGSIKLYKLSNQDIVDIFNSSLDNKTLAKQYDVDKVTIWGIKRGSTRKFFNDNCDFE